MKNLISALAWIAASIFVSEFLGYFLHRLLHSGKIGFFSRNHMKHHLVLYGPLQSQRPGTGYQDATSGEVAIGNVGLEWLIPGSVLLGGSLGLLHLFQVPLLHQLIFVAGTLVWSFLMFSYLHDRMHLAGFWMERHPLLKRWFVAARDAHDIHHWSLNDDGFMDKNFGIAFFFFDRLFGTLACDAPAFNRRGYASALWRFGDLLHSPGVRVEETNWHPLDGRSAPDQHPRSRREPSEVAL
jgi:sterol desaturase/sphingolipid hydroxylase (fatty acid hydroxylase superfamily)